MELYCPSFLQGLKNLPHSISTDPPAVPLGTFLQTPEGVRIHIYPKNSQPSCSSFPSGPNPTNPKLSDLIHTAEKRLQTPQAEKAAIRMPLAFPL